jgi:hypothetical protein
MSTTNIRPKAIIAYRKVKRQRMVQQYALDTNQENLELEC